MPEKLLQIRNLRTHFRTEHGTVRAVDDVSYDVCEGETLALVGESGCGKSISALSIMRLVPNTGRIVGGEIIFENQNLTELSEAQMREIRGSRISMVFQEPMTSLNPVVCIGEQIAEPLRVHLKLSVVAARKKAIELLESVGISDAERRYRNYPHHFSGGMRQRVMIAMAISCQPKIIIADEPTTALDVTIQAQLLDLMTELARRSGAALVLITHNLGIVARYADRVNIMYAGRIVESADGDSLYKSPRHPYTLGLMRCVPRIGQDGKTSQLTPIEGLPPDLSKEICGCYFQPRCPSATPKCAVEYPPMTGAENHRFACFNPARVTNNE